ncbi:MAG: type II CRISPR RNA-guided endonuclease Cas9 [Erysipelotrichaceae bacterium]
MEKREYCIGLDIGDASVGWAVTDMEGKIIRIKGKRAMGVRLFDIAETAQARRVFRSTRRRLQRRKQRITLLQEQLAPMVQAVDDNFFMKLKASKLLAKDSLGYKTKFNLFEDGELTDKSYYQQYPTIYHLRAALVEQTEKADPRLIYLALHHCLKYRGHFLFEGQEFNIQDTTAVEEALLVVFKNVCGIDVEAQVEQLIGVLKDVSIARKVKTERFVNILSTLEGFEVKRCAELAKSLIGLKANFAVLFDDEQLLEEDGKKLSFSLSNDYVDDKVEKYDSLLEAYSEEFALINQVYAWAVLQQVLLGETSISSAMIKKYDTHKADLKQLKSVLRSQPKLYKEMFKNKKNQDCIYEQYIHASGKMDAINFYKKVKAMIDKVEIDLSIKQDILSKVEEGSFLSLQTSKANAAIPFQLHEKEFSAIIANQSVYYPELVEKNLNQLIRFRIPYYVGPLNKPQDKNDFNWMVRKEAGKITPWNFEEKVDRHASAEAFIKRMTNTCTYLMGEEVLPKNSITYKRFMLLNEINQLKIIVAGQEKESKLTQTMKEELIQTLFIEKKKKTVKKEDLINTSTLQEAFYGVADIKGFSDEDKFANNLSSELDFIRIFGVVDTSNIDMIETIIYYLTIFEDRQIVKEKLQQEYPSITREQLAKILKLPYKGWGQLSNKLLTVLKHKDEQTQESFSIMDYLERDSDVFMKLITNTKLSFKKQIDESLSLTGDPLSYQTVKELAGSPAIKRGIWQSMLIVKEIVALCGCEPNSIFVEMARSEDEKKRSVNRKTAIEKMYKEHGNVDKHIKDELDKADRTFLQNERVYLYFIQLGRCLYSKEKLDLNQLQHYDVDHIIPRSMVKDDSLENKALVIGTYNKIKGDDKFPKDIIKAKFAQKESEVLAFWKMLLDKKLIGEKKYASLMRTSFSEGQEASFVARQLVETRQITKHVVNILTQGYQDTKVHAIRANTLSELRSKLDFIKSREVNDHHHAFDALLAIHMGLFIRNRYPKLEKEFIYSEFKKYSKSSKKDMDKKGKHGFLIDSFVKDYVNNETGEVWQFSTAIKHLKQGYRLPEVIVTRKLEENLVHGFYNQTVYPKATAKISLGKHPLDKSKLLPAEDYGGYSSEEMQYYCIVEKLDKKKKRQLNLVGLPVRIVALEKTKKDAITSYLNETLECDYRVVKEKICKYQRFQQAGNDLRLVSHTEWINNRQLHLDNEYLETITVDIDRKLAKCKTEEEVICAIADCNEQLIETYDELCNKMKNYYPLFSGVHKKIVTVKEKYVNLEVAEKKKNVFEILKVMKASSINGNLKKIGGTDREGRLCNRPTDCTNWTFVDESITGLITKSYTL